MPVSCAPNMSSNAIDEDCVVIFVAAIEVDGASVEGVRAGGEADFETEALNIKRNVAKVETLALVLRTAPFLTGDRLEKVLCPPATVDDFRLHT